MTTPDELAKKFWRAMERMSEEDRQKLDRAPIEKSQETTNGKATYLGSLPNDDPIYGGQPKVKSISLGWAKPDDPIYTNAGWNFIMGKNLNPKPKS